MEGPVSELSSEGLDERRRKLLFRCRHRGIREMDFVLGRFADAELPRLSDAELTVRIEHPNFNSRTVTGDGTPIRPDLKKLLYGKS